jgi:hypothetical protein
VWWVIREKKLRVPLGEILKGFLGLLAVLCS